MADTIKSVDVPAVHGMVALNPDGTAIGTPVGGATSDNQTNGSQKTQIVDAGGEVATVTGGKLDVNATASLSGDSIPAQGVSTAVSVQIVDGSGDQIVSFGGGTQYTEDTSSAANPVGTALMLVREDARAGSLTTADGDNVAARGNNKGELYVKTTDSDALLTTIDADTSNISTKIDTIAGAVSGTEVQVDVLTMPTTTVQATDLDIRNLTNTDVVTAELSATDNAVLDAIAAKDFSTETTLSAMNAKLVSGTDIGDVTINNASGASAVNIQDGGNTITVDGTVAVTSAGITTIAGAVSGTEMQVDVVTMPAVTNAGTFAVQVDGSALTALQKIDDPVVVDDAAFTPATSSVMVAGFEADESSTDSVDEGDAGAARMTLDRKQIVTPQPHTTGGLLIFRSLDIDETEEEIKASAGQVYGYYIFNASTSIRYVKFYNATAANVTVGTTTPVITIPVPAASSGGVAANLLSTHGIAFDTAITVAATTGLADNDTGAPSANDVIINVFYK